MSKTIESISFATFLHIPYLTEEVVALVLYLICLFVFFRKKRASEKFWLAVLFLYLGVVWGMTIPFAPPNLWHVSAKSTALAVRSIRWVPFLSAANILHNALSAGNLKEFFRVIGGNFVLLMPLGVLVPLCNPRFRLGRMFAVAILTPVGIEGLQLLGNILRGSVLRTVETEDVLLNAAGCILAYLIFAGLRRLFQPKKKGKRYATARK
jgi:Glycopeptide antibiotics resistance protein